MGIVRVYYPCIIKIIKDRAKNKKEPDYGRKIKDLDSDERIFLYKEF